MRKYVDKRRKIEMPLGNKNIFLMNNLYDLSFPGTTR